MRSPEGSRGHSRDGSPDATVMTNQHLTDALEHARDLRAEGITWDAEGCPIREADGRDIVVLADEIERLQRREAAAREILEPMHDCDQAIRDWLKGVGI